MRQKTERHQAAAERTIKDIRRRTRKRYSSEEKIRIVLAGLLIKEVNKLASRFDATAAWLTVPMRPDDGTYDFPFRPNPIFLAKADLNAA